MMTDEERAQFRAALDDESPDALRRFIDTQIVRGLLQDPDIQQAIHEEEAITLWGYPVVRDPSIKNRTAVLQYPQEPTTTTNDQPVVARAIEEATALDYRDWRKIRRRALLQELRLIEDQMRRDGDLPGRHK